MAAIRNVEASSDAIFTLAGHAQAVPQGRIGGAAASREFRHMTG